MISIARLSEGRVFCLVCRQEGESIEQLGKHGLHMMSLCASCKMPVLLVSTVYYGELATSLGVWPVMRKVEADDGAE